MNWKHFTIALAVTFLLAGTAIAQPGPGMGMGKRPGNQQGDIVPPMGQMQGCIKGLNLDDDQKAKIEKLRLEHQKEMLALRTETAGLRDKLKLLITADKFDQKAVNDLSDKIAKTHEKRANMMAKHLRSVRDILNDEQKVKFDQHVISGKMGFHGPGFDQGMMQHGKFHRGHRQHKRCW